MANVLESKSNKCIEMVYVGIWHGSRRCHRNEFKDGYCKQHHPESIKKKEVEAKKKHDEKFNNSPLGKAQVRIKELEETNKKLIENICVYAREELGNMNFETDKDVLEYFSTFNESNY